MKRRSEPPAPTQNPESPTFENLIGLGSHSARKSHYAVLEAKLLELEAERNRYKWLFENALHGIFQADFNGSIRAANPAFASICGYEDNRQVLLQPNHLKLLFVDSLEYENLKQQLLNDGKVFRFPAILKRQDGVEINISMNALLKREEGEDIFEAFVQDITAYKKAQQDLTQLNEELEARVTSRTQQLTRVNDKLIDEISERKLILEQLHLAKDAAELANRSKDKYLAAASHDLLQPMNAARLLVSALQEREFSAEDSHLIDCVHLALEGAEDLLNDLLYISKLDQNAVQPQLDVYSVQQLLAGLEGEFHPLAKSKNLQFHVLPSKLNIRSDTRLLSRILRNLISNALRYTTSGKVLVGCRRHGDNISIQVWDTGQGIPEDRLQDVFREFHQLNSYPRGIRKGVGLGLAIVDRLARMLDHHVEVRSELNKGSMFSVDVPLVEASVSTPQKLGVKFSYNNLENACVLVLDNDENILLSMGVLLKQWGCVVYQARDQYEAIELCKAESLKPDLILADYHLDEGQTGIDAILAMRECAGIDIPAAIITADYSDDLGQIFRDLNLPMINKPVKPANLRALLSHLIEH